MDTFLGLGHLTICCCFSTKQPRIPNGSRNLSARPGGVFGVLFFRVESSRLVSFCLLCFFGGKSNRVYEIGKLAYGQSRRPKPKRVDGRPKSESESELEFQVPIHQQDQVAILQICLCVPKRQWRFNLKLGPAFMSCLTDCRLPLTFIYLMFRLWHLVLYYFIWLFLCQC